MKKATIAIVAAGATTLAFFAGGYFGHGYGVSQCVRAVNNVLAAADYPTVYLTYPGKYPVAIVHDGYCTPFPRHIPEFYHYHYVSPQWQPCTQLGGGLKIKASPALAAVQKEVQK